MFILPYIFLFVLGCCIGSFINVVVDRLARNESLNGRSYCENCKQQLKPLDLVPVLSYVALKGRCRYCHTKLSSQYLIVEAFTGITFVFVYYLLTNSKFIITDYLNNAQHILDYGIVIPLIFYLIVCTGLIILTITDFKYGLLFDKVMIPTIVFVLLYKIATLAYYFITYYQKLNSSDFGKVLLQVGFLSSRLQFAIKPFLYTLAGSLAIALFFLILILVTKGRGMGGGDLKLGFLVGLLTGWPNMIMAIFVGFLTGAVASTILLLAHRKKVGQTIPFGPFLILGCFIVIFFGDQLFGWYLRDILGIK